MAIPYKLVKLRSRRFLSYGSLFSNGLPTGRENRGVTIYFLRTGTSIRNLQPLVSVFTEDYVKLGDPPQTKDYVTEAWISIDIK